jgi:TRAP-type C4-dicarboxylate transport system permease small subunit
LKRLDTLITGAGKLGSILEDTVLVIILGSMILLAASQILLRNLFDVGFIWSDELLRMLVLWIAVAGAVAASRSDRHININVLDRFLPEKAQVFTQLLVHSFTAFICAVVCWVSVQFVSTSYEYGDVLLGSIPAWLLQLVLPVGFGLIAWRYLLFFIQDLWSIFAKTK